MYSWVMKLDANARRRISRRASAIARRESPTGTVAPAFVIRAAIECGFGTLSRTLTDGVRGQKACGLVLSDAEWQGAILAMESVGSLYCSEGRWVYVEREEQMAA